VKHAVQREIWIPTQHLLCDQGKPRKILIELAGRGPSRCKLTSSQQSGIKYESPNSSPLHRATKSTVQMAAPVLKIMETLSHVYAKASYSVRNLMSSYLLSKTVKIRILKL
jgi:hypothetical protein